MSDLYYQTFDDFNESLNNFKSKINQYEDLELNLKKDVIKLYKKYCEYPQSILFNAFPSYKYSRYDWELYILSKYDKMDFRFLDKNTQNVRSFIIQLVMLQNHKNSSYSDMGFMENLIKQINTFEEILEIVEIIKEQKFLSPKYSKNYSDNELNKIMLNEKIKETMDINTSKLEKLFNYCIKDNDSLKNDLTINFNFKDIIITKYIHSFIFIDEYFTNALEKFSQTKILNFYFSEINYCENLIIEIIRYLYIGTVNFENLSEENIMILSVFGNQLMLNNLEEICERYLQLDNKITNCKLSDIEIEQIHHPKINSLYLYNVDRLTKFYVIEKNNKLYYIYGGKMYGSTKILIDDCLKGGIYRNVPVCILKYFDEYKINYDLNIINEISERLKM